MNRRIAVRAVIVDDDGKIFCVNQRHRRTKDPLPYWCLPGGGVDPGEAFIPALRREIIEELDVEPEIGRLLYIQQYMDDEQEQMELFFHVTNAYDYRDIDISSATHAADEIVEHGFVDPKTTKVLPTLLTEEDIVRHIETSQPTKLFSYFDKA